MSGIFPEPKVSATDALTRYTSPAAGDGTAGVLIKAAARGRLYKLRTMNKAATAYTIMIFDKATAPVNADVPIWRASLANVIGSENELDFNLWGLQFNNGLGIAISSTPGTLTLAVALDAFFHALYC